MQPSLNASENKQYFYIEEEERNDKTKLKEEIVVAGE